MILPAAASVAVSGIRVSEECVYIPAEAGLGAPQMVVMSDTDDPFVPLPDDLLVNLRESREVFESLLDSLPATFASNSQVSDLRPAIDLADCDQS